MNGRERVLVALSGGGDSLALAALLADWARGRSCRILALTVDHGLRPVKAVVIPERLALAQPLRIA